MTKKNYLNTFWSGVDVNLVSVCVKGTGFHQIVQIC